MFKQFSLPLILLVVSLVSIKPAQADFAGIYIGAGVWNHEAEGNMNYVGTNADLETDLKFKDETNAFSYIKIEHPVPLIPNLLVSRYALGHNGSGTVSATTGFTFGGTTYTTGDNITTELKLDSTDVVLYYEFWDTIFGFDLGLGTKTISGKAEVVSGGVRNTRLIESTEPIVYMQLSLSVPGTGFSLSADGKHNILQDSTICDYSYKLTYETDYFLGVEAGLRGVKMKLKNLDSIDGDLDFTGPFVNLLLHF